MRKPSWRQQRAWHGSGWSRADRARGSGYLGTARQSTLRPADDAQVGAPRSHLVRVLPGEHARNLHDVVEVVRHPRRQELSQRDATKLGVAAAAIELAVSEG